MSPLSHGEMAQMARMHGNSCVICGEEIPEGRMVCPICEKQAEETLTWVYPSDVEGFGRCPKCHALWESRLIENIFFIHCPRCGAKVCQKSWKYRRKAND